MDPNDYAVVNALPRRNLVRRVIVASLGCFFVFAIAGVVLFSRCSFAQGLQVTLSAHRGSVNRIVFAPDGRKLATCGEDMLTKIWDVSSGVELAILRGHIDQVTDVCFSPDNTLVATASLDGSVRIWDAKSGKQQFSFFEHSKPDAKGHPKASLAVAFSPDGLTLASGGADTTVRLWEVSSGKQRSVFENAKGVASLLFTTDGRQLVSRSTDGTIKVWDITIAKELRRFDELSGGFAGGLIRLEGNKIASNEGSKSKIQLWDADSGDLQGVLTADLSWQDSPVRCMAYSAKSRTIAGATLSGGHVLFWDAQSKEFLGAVKLSSPKSIALSPEGTVFASAHEDGTVKLWATEKLIPRNKH